MHQFENPPGMPKPAGHFHHVITVTNETQRVVVSGQLGVRPDGTIAPDIEGQTEQTYANILTALKSKGMGWGDVVRFAIYLTDKSYIEPFFKVRARILGDHKPASTLLIVAGLMKPEWLIEIDCEAAR